MIEKNNNSAGSRVPNKNYFIVLVAAVVVVSSIAGGIEHFRQNNAIKKWLESPTSGDNRIEYAYSSQKIESNIEIIAFGSSRTAFGLEVKTLAASIGLHPEKAVNMAFPALSHGYALLQIKRYYDEFTAAKIWILGIDDYMLLKPNKEEIDKKLKLTQRLEAQLEQFITPIINLNYSGGELFQNLKAYVGWVVRPRLNVWTITDSGKWSNDGRESISDAENPNISREQIENRKKILREYLKDNAVRVVSNYFGNKEFNPTAIKPSTDIMEIAKTNGIKIIIIDPPYHPDYIKISGDKYSEMIDKTQNAYRTLATSYSVQFITCYDEPDNCGVTEDDFSDAVHLNEVGAKKYTAYLANKLRHLK